MIVTPKFHIIECRIVDAMKSTEYWGYFQKKPQKEINMKLMYYKQ